MRRLGLLSSIALCALAIAACSGEGGEDAVRVQAAAADGSVCNGKLTEVATGLEFPWAMAMLPEGGLLVTEREGRLTRVDLTGDVADNKLVLSGGPEPYVQRQGGYLGLVLDPEFASNRTLYLSFAKGTQDENSTSVYRAKLAPGGTGLTEGEVIYEATKRNTAFHYGGRLDFLPDRTLLVTLGDGFRYMAEAQNPENTHGSIVRINTDGSIPADNPLSGQSGRSGEIYSYGHRNVQGLLVDDDSGRVYAHEHGPKGGDELNLIIPGANYGWPEITYGVNYDGTIITSETAQDGMQQPLERWVPSIAPSGMIKVKGNLYPGWQGDILIGAMNGPAGRKLVRVDLDAEGNVAGTEDLLEECGFGYRDVLQDPASGQIYLATNDLEGAIYKLNP